MQYADIRPDKRITRFARASINARMQKRELKNFLCPLVILSMGADLY